MSVGAGLSKLTILEPPKPGGVYYMGTDPIPFGDKKEVSLESEERSKQCSIVLREDLENPNGPYPVAIYLARTNDLNFVFSETLMLQRIYNDCQNNIERNMGAAFMQAYQDTGQLHKLARYPYTALLPNWQVIQVPKKKRMLHGWNNDHSTRPTAVNLLAAWLPHGLKKTNSVELVEDVQNLGIENTDLAWALISGLILWKHKTNIIRHKFKEQKVSKRLVWVMEGGRRVQKLITVGDIGDEGIDINLGNAGGYHDMSSHRGFM